MCIQFAQMSLAKIITRNSAKARVVITSTSLAFWFARLIKGVKNAASSGIAIIRIGECVISLSKLLSFHCSGLF